MQVLSTFTESYILAKFDYKIHVFVVSKSTTKLTLTTCWLNVYFNVKHICITRNNATLSQIGNYAINFSAIIIETT